MKQPHANSRNTVGLSASRRKMFSDSSLPIRNFFFINIPFGIPYGLAGCQIELLGWRECGRTQSRSRSFSSKHAVQRSSRRMLQEVRGKKTVVPSRGKILQFAGKKCGQGIWRASARSLSDLADRVGIEPPRAFPFLKVTDYTLPRLPTIPELPGLLVRCCPMASHSFHSPPQGTYISCCNLVRLGAQVPKVGLEPTTLRLRGECSASLPAATGCYKFISIVQFSPYLLPADCYL